MSRATSSSTANSKKAIETSLRTIADEDEDDKKRECSPRIDEWSQQEGNEKNKSSQKVKAQAQCQSCHKDWNKKVDSVFEKTFASFRQALEEAANNPSLPIPKFEDFNLPYSMNKNGRVTGVDPNLSVDIAKIIPQYEVGKYHLFEHKLDEDDDSDVEEKDEKDDDEETEETEVDDEECDDEEDYDDEEEEEDGDYDEEDVDNDEEPSSYVVSN